MKRLEIIKDKEYFSDSKRIEKNKKRFEKFKLGYSHETLSLNEASNKYVNRGVNQNYLNNVLSEAIEKGDVNLGLNAIEEIKTSHITSPSKNF